MSRRSYHLKFTHSYLQKGGGGQQHEIDWTRAANCVLPRGSLPSPPPPPSFAPFPYKSAELQT